MHRGISALLRREDTSLLGERLAVSLGEAEEAAVRLSVEKLELALDTLTDTLVHLLLREKSAHRRVEEGDVPPPLVHERVDRLVVRAHRREDSPQRRVHRGPDEVVALAAGLAGLRHEDSTWVELRLDHLVELGGVQLVARPSFQRVIQIHDDHVVRPALLEHRLRVVDHQLQPRIGKRLGVLGQRVFAEAHHVAVDVDHHALLDGGVPQDFSRGRPLASSADVHRFGARVRQHRRVDERLMVHMLVDLARLDEPIDHQRAAEALEVDHIDGLPLGLTRVEHFLQAVKSS
mmetsp:Transcript_34880/g.86758  ORF Transcript_34880/g.86758 Transcript_34880/m.86758 type:complete len:290 (-) Transcript_34880:88-957(-)